MVTPGTKLPPSLLLDAHSSKENNVPSSPRVVSVEITSSFPELSGKDMKQLQEADAWIGWLLFYWRGGSVPDSRQPGTECPEILELLRQ